MRTDTKPLPGKRKLLRIEKSMVKTNSPEKKLGAAIPKAPELIYFDEVSVEFTREAYKKICKAQKKRALVLDPEAVDRVSTHTK